MSKASRETKLVTQAGSNELTRWTYSLQLNCTYIKFYLSNKLSQHSCTHAPTIWNMRTKFILLQSSLFKLTRFVKLQERVLQGEGDWWDKKNRIWWRKILLVEQNSIQLDRKLDFVDYSRNYTSKSWNHDFPVNFKNRILLHDKILFFMVAINSI